MDATVEKPDSSESAKTAPRWSGRKSARTLAEEFGLLAIFVVLFVVFSVIAPGFLSADNVQIVLGEQAVLGILALAIIVPLLCGQFDLSVATNMGASGIVFAACTSHYHLSMVVAIIVTMVWCLIIGLVNGFMVTVVRVNSFIVTLAMSTLLAGLVQWYTNGLTISTGIPQSLTRYSTGVLGIIPKGVLWLLPVAVALWYLVEHTPFGRYLTSIGSNQQAARILGINTRRVVLLSFVICALLGGAAAILAVGQAGDADPEVAQGALLLPALAAAFLGSSALKPGRFNVAGTVLAVYFVAFSVSGLEFLGVATWIQQVFDAVALAGAVTTTTIISRKHREA